MRSISESLESSGHFSSLSDHDCKTSRAFLQRFRLVTLTGLAAGFKISWDFENPKSGQTVIYWDTRKRDEKSATSHRQKNRSATPKDIFDRPRARS